MCIYIKFSHHVDFFFGVRLFVSVDITFPGLPQKKILDLYRYSFEEMFALHPGIFAVLSLPNLLR